MGWIQTNAVNLAAIVGALYVVALTVVKLTPTPRDDDALAKVSPILRAVAGLFGLDLKQGVEAKKE